MADIFLDCTTKPFRRYVTNRCHYCDHDKYPQGKVIDPTTDKQARQMKDGSFMCGYCVTEKSLSLFGAKK
jgi:hypothetical protein